MKPLPMVTEAQHQTALFDWWALVHRKYGLPECALIHIPNEGKRSVRAALALKRQGMRKGVSDILLCAHSGEWHGLWIELKRRGGAVSSEQREFLAAMRDCGYDGAVCYGWEQARDMIVDYLDGA